MNKIPVTISSDNNIFYTVGVVLTSLLENASPDTFYEINCLCAGDVTEEKKKKLSELKNKYTNFTLTFFDMKDKFKDIPTTKGYHVNYVSAYKMLIPSMFPQYDKMIYLDTDIIVREDLSELYNQNIDGYCLAGTPVISNLIYNHDYLVKTTNMPNLDFYINAGVMLMNLNEIRKNNIDEK